MASNKPRKPIRVNAADQFGVRANGSTDDTAALQDAIDYGIANDAVIQLPSGVMPTSDTLTIPGGVVIEGGANIGNGYSSINYTGTGEAVRIKSATYDASGTLTYGVTIRNLHVRSAAGLGDKAFAMYGANECLFENLTVGAVGESGRFTTAFHVQQGGLLEFRRATASYCGTAMSFIGKAGNRNAICSAIQVRSFNFFEVTNGFNVTGVNGLDASGGWMETFDYGVLVDDADADPGVEVKGLWFHHNTMTANGGATKTNQIPLKLKGVAAKLFRAEGVHFHHNLVQMVGGAFSEVPYPVLVDLVGTPDAFSLPALCVHNNSFYGDSAFLKILSTNHAQITAKMTHNFSYVNGVMVSNRDHDGGAGSVTII
jgi:hypothetical protein